MITKNRSEIMKNVLVIYTDNVQERFEAICIRDKMVIIGRILEGEFVNCGIIPKGNIKEIHDGSKKIQLN